MKTKIRRNPGRPPRPRSRFGYDGLWRGVAPPEAPVVEDSYWKATRRPIPCLVFVVPLILTYEAGVLLIGGASADSLRTGADAWMRQALAAIGLRDRWLPPLALIGAMLAWGARRPGAGGFRMRCLPGMAAESLILAVALVGLSRLVELGFDRLDARPILEASGNAKPPMASILGFVGAGVYEEALFRLALIPLIYGLGRLVHAPAVVAGTIAVTGSSLLFSLAHHAGMPGETFTLFAFTFRWLAGIFFAWVFLVRGFGIAVGTHAAYDVLVGWVGLHF